VCVSVCLCVSVFIIYTYIYVSTYVCKYIYRSYQCNIPVAKEGYMESARKSGMS
jgi:hypothetical protein